MVTIKQVIAAEQDCMLQFRNFMLPLENKTIHKIISRKSTLSITIKVYLRSSLSSLSNEVFFTA